MCSIGRDRKIKMLSDFAQHLLDLATVKQSSLGSDCNVCIHRYYHLFTREELVGLVSALPGVRVVDVFYDKSNWCIVFERMPSDNYFDGEP